MSATSRITVRLVQLHCRYQPLDVGQSTEAEYHQAVREASQYVPALPLYAARCGPLQLQPMHAHLTHGLRRQRALLPVTVGAMNIHDVRDRQTSDIRQDHRLAPPPGAAEAYKTELLWAGTKNCLSL